MAATYPPAPGPSAPADQDTRIGLLRAVRVVVLFVYAVVLVNLVLLLLGFVLRLFGASTDAAFTRWVYRSVDRIMEPFRGMFPTHVSGDSVFDTSLLFAMIVYALIGIALHALVTWLAAKIVALRRQDRPRPGPGPGYPPGPGPAAGYPPGTTRYPTGY
jgi:hypothetical protein